MKYILAFLLVAGFSATAQDSTAVNCKLIKETDPYTKEKVISSGFIGMQGGSLTIDANKQEINMLFTVSGADKCFSTDATAAIFFTGTKIKQTQRHNGAMNCEGIVQLTFRNTTLPPQLLRRFATQKVEKILFIGNNKKETIVTLTPEQQQILLNLSVCMMNESPTLLQ
jgi:hypothetical protein